MTGVDVVIEMEGCKCVRKFANVEIMEDPTEYSFISIKDKDYGITNIPLNDIHEIHIFFNKRPNYDYLDNPEKLEGYYDYKNKEDNK